MRIYLAGMDSSTYRSLALKEGYENILISYYHSFYPDNKLTPRHDNFKQFNIFLDSGGYTARVSGNDIDINKYASFIKNHRDIFDVAANLDVYNWKTSMANQDILEKAGGIDKITPVYHFSEYADKEKKEELIRLCKKYPYVAIGGTAGTVTNRKAITKFLNYCFKVGIEHKTKFHGFGMTAKYLLDRYPFYSVDSTSWMVGARYGQVLSFEKGVLKMMSKGSTPRPEHFTGHLYNAVKGIRMFSKMQKHYTDLWAKRGITWKN
jgi:hypothetical protein